MGEATTEWTLPGILNTLFKQDVAIMKTFCYPTCIFPCQRPEMCCRADWEHFINDVQWVSDAIAARQRRATEDPLHSVFAAMPEPKLMLKVEEDPAKGHLLGFAIQLDNLSTSERNQQRWLAYCAKYKNVFQQWATKKLVWMPVGSQNPIAPRYRCPKAVLTKQEKNIQDRLDYFAKKEFAVLSQQKESFTPPCNHVLDRPVTMFDEFFSPAKHTADGGCGMHWH